MAVYSSDWGGGRKQLALQVKGPDLATINQAAEQIRQVALKTPGAVDVALSSKGQRPELTVDLDRGLAGSLGITVGQVAQALRPAFAGIDAGDWVDPSGETRDVTVRLAPEARRRAEDLRQLPLMVAGSTTMAPKTVPLGQVVKVTSGLGPAVINHLNRDLVVNVEWNAQGRSTGEVMSDVQAALAAGAAAARRHLLGGRRHGAAERGVRQHRARAHRGGGADVPHPGDAVRVVPRSRSRSCRRCRSRWSGVMLALSVTGLTINIMSLIGVILLMGIVAKNAILLIDFAKWSHESGKPIREALIEAGAIRLRPILMTTFALIAGMIPVALGRGEGAQFRQPLGVAVIGGVHHLDAS